MDMRIDSTSYYQNLCLLDTAGKNVGSMRMAEKQKHSGNASAVAITISEEGLNVLREKVREFGTESYNADIGEWKVQNTNEVAWEHYMTMMEASSLQLKDGNYNVEDFMKSIMDTYESLYCKIVKEHENGDRQVSYELTGKRSLTLEEDLAGLDKAFQMRLANLEGYITSQQTNKAFANPDCAWYFRRNNLHFRKNEMQSKVEESKDYNYFDKEYQHMAVSMMKQARGEFLALVQNSNYKKGAAIGIISGILNQNIDFLEKTKKLFS